MKDNPVLPDYLADSFWDFARAELARVCRHLESWSEYCQVFRDTN